MTTTISGGPVRLPLILHQPGPLVECQTSELSWQGNVGDTGILVYYADTIPDGEGAALEFLPIVPAGLTTTTWLVDQFGPFNYTLLLHDRSTAAVSTVFVSVAANPDGDTSCLGKDPQFDPRGTSTAIGGSSTTPSSTAGQPTSPTSTTSDQSSVGPSSPGGSSSTSLPPTSSLTGLPSTDVSPTQASSSVSDHHHASVVGPIVGAVFALLIVGGLGGFLYMRHRKRLRMRNSERPMGGEINAFEVPRPVAKRPLVIMEAEPPASTQQQPLASLREENNVLGEENAVLRAVIARMQTSLPVPGDSETLPSYESRPVRS